MISQRTLAAFTLVVCTGATACNDNQIAGAQPDIEVSPAGLTFDRVGTGDDAAQVITIRNIGDLPLRVTGLRIPPRGTGYWTAGTPPTRNAPWSLAPGEQAPVEVHFTPRRPGPATTRLFVYSNDPDTRTASVKLVGDAFRLQRETFFQGEDVTAASGFELLDTPLPDTLEVWVEGVGLPRETWRYHPGPNRLEILEPWVPDSGARIDVAYEVGELAASANEL